MSALLTLGAKMGAADYEISVTNKTDAEDKATYTLTAEVAALSTLEFQGENLILTSIDGKTAAVGLKGFDQFGGEVTLTNSNLQLYSSVSSEGVTFDNDTQRVIVTVDQAILLNVGSTVTVTAMYNTGTTYIQKAQPLTVAQRAYVGKLEFGELTTTKTTLKDQRVTLTATDQYGDAFDLYECYDDSSRHDNSITFGSRNNLTNAWAKIEATGSGKFTYTKDTNKKTVKLTYAPNVADKTVVMTVTTCSSKVTPINVTINTQGYATGIKGLAASVNTSMIAGQQVDFTDLNKLIFLDSYGATMAADNTLKPDFVSPTTATTNYTNENYPFNDGYGDAMYTVEKVGTWTTGSALTNGLYEAGATAPGTDTVKVTLYPVKKNTANAFEWDTPVTKNITLTVVDQKDLKYSIAVADGKTLHVGKAADLVTSPSVTIKLTATDKAGTVVDVKNKLTKVTTDKGLNGVVDSANNKATISYDGSTEVTGKGTMKVSATVVGFADAVTCDLNYDDAASVATSSYFQKYNGATKAWTDTTDVLGSGYTATSAAVTVQDDDTLCVNGKVATDGYYAIGIADQYGDDMYDSKLVQVSTGNYIVPGEPKFTPSAENDVQLRLTNGTVNQVVSGTWVTGITTPAEGGDVILKGTWGQGGTSSSVSSAATLKAALDAAASDDTANIIVVEKDITGYPYDLEVPAGDTLILGKSVILATGKNITVYGTLSVEDAANLAWAASTTAGTTTIDATGTVIVKAGGLFATNGTTVSPAAITNNGTIEIAFGGTMESSSTVANGGTITNEGTFEATTSVTNSKTITIGNNATFTATVKTPGSHNAAQVVATGVLTQYTSSGDIAGLYSSSDAPAIKIVSYAYDSSTSTTDVTYKVTGTLLNAPSCLTGAPLSYGTDYHWGLGVQVASITDSTASTLKYGSNFAEGTYTPVSGWMTETNNSETKFVAGWKTAPTASNNKFIVQYAWTGTGAETVNDIIDVSGMTFTPAS